ncbi:MAG: hypothetical protein FJ077_03925 [Cyanobacteria bacterium K_DeepCast_35m_m2_023]|nr:hypothetical protein [Cyanobacteria bacterium K_DeepCast_35m_m2_023]
MGSALDSLWQAAVQAIDAQAWHEAEGLLWRYLQLEPAAATSVHDSLGYALLMQGDFVGCERVLQPYLEAADRSFWLSHKLGDALRGQHRLDEAASLYRRSLAEGSDSPLTTRNLLQTLYGLAPAAALAELTHWQQDEASLPVTAWSGAREAAALVPGLELADWLWQHGQDDAHCRRRLLEEHCYALNLHGCWTILQQLQAPSCWEQQLMRKLHELLLVPAAAAPAPDAAAPPR